MGALGQFIGVKYEPEMRRSRTTNPGQFILPEESWKEKVTRPIQKTPSKFKRLFGGERRKKIEQVLDLEGYLDIDHSENFSL